MDTIIATIHNGQNVPKQAFDWPEGAEVEVSLVMPERAKLGMTENEWPTTPEGIAALRAKMAEVGPLEFTPEEEADWKAWRQKQKEYDIANMPQRIERLFE